MRGVSRTLQDAALMDFQSPGISPQKVALVDGQSSVTHGELARWTDRLANQLREAGAGPGVNVAIAHPRSIAWVVAVIAAVKAGAAYVPLDPDYPSARLETMIERCRPRVLLGASAAAERLSLPESTRILSLGDIPGERESCAAPPPTSSPDDPLYTIFTSGSTGSPKGAVVRRRGFANLIEWFSREFSVNSEDRFLLLSSPSFDLTQKNLFVPIKAGATAIVYPSGPFDLALLADLIARHQITILNCTPSAFYPLVETADDAALARLASLRLVVLGGEPITMSRLERWRSLPSCRAEIANTYGPTECTDICAFHRLPAGEIPEYLSMPLGQTLPNVQLAVLDEKQRPCPDGEAGELVIGGAGVGPGYLDDPERTADRFIPNPCPQYLEGLNVYRSGDRVQVGPDGALEFLGRQDFQVKIRGFRIELPEIEVALSSHPGVREAVVLADDSGQRLVAFYVPQQNAPDPEALRLHLADRLPEHMVPASFRDRDEFPLTPNGKVDRLRLQSQLLPDPSPSSDLELPADSSDLATLIPQLWSHVLAVPITSPDENFFDAGGDSLRLASLHALLATRLNRRIAITDLFAHPTIRGQVAFLSAKPSPTTASADPDVPPPAPTDTLARAARQRQALAARSRR